MFKAICSFDSRLVSNLTNELNSEKRRDTTYNLYLEIKHESVNEH